MAAAEVATNLRSRIPRISVVGIVRWLAERFVYGVIGMAFFILFLWLTFPSEALRIRLKTEIERVTRVPVEIGDVSLGMGLTLDNVSFSLNPQPGETKRRRINVESISVWPKPIYFFQGSTGAGYRVAGFGGTIEGEGAGTEEFVGVDFDMTDLAVDALQAIAFADLPVKLAGTIGGNVNLELVSPKPDENKGTVSLDLAGFMITGGEVSGFKLPKVDFGTVTLLGELKGRRLYVKKLEGKGRDVELMGEGMIDYNPTDMSRTRLELKCKIKVGEKFWAENKPLAVMRDVMLKQYVRKDGYYGFSVNGPFASPRTSVWHGDK